MIRLSGRFRSALIIGTQGIRSRKTRTFLSMVSLFLGVLAVVVVQVGAEVARSAQLADLELQAGKDGTRQAYLPGGGDVMRITEETLRGRDDGVAAINQMAIIGEPDVRPINPGAMPFEDGSMAYDPGGGAMVCDERGCRPMEQFTPQVPGQAIEVQIVALTGDVRQFRPFRPVAGEWLDFTGDPSLSPRIVINEEAAEGFRRHQVPAEMRVTGTTANPTPRIIGVVDDGSPQPTAYLRADELDTWRAPGGADDQGAGIQVMLAPTAGDLEQLLRARLVAAGVPADNLQFSTIDIRKSIARELALVRWIFLGMAGLVLLIGVAGILNVGLATVGERVEEFALRRAVGTPRSLLAGIVLAETLLTGLFTAVAAIGLSALGLTAISTVLGGREEFLRDLAFPWQAGVAGVIAGLVAGLLGGLIPAIRAARIPIATVMRA
ncbi:ABC transporter permease [Plantactinospora sp. GCM10030261]|uniref:ABC transporter permease n=1 Tax=Plantactinospora sp. GCM10030261 TaxID=3273420 RepID=UPI003616BB91